MQSLKLVRDKNSAVSFNKKNHGYYGRLSYRSGEGS